MNNSCLKLKVLRNLLREPLFAAFQEALCGGEPEKFYYQLYEAGAENNFLSGLCELILADDNAFARTCAKGDTPSSYLFDAYAGDIDAIFSAAARFEGDEHFRLGEPVPPFDGSLDGARSAAGLADHYAAHGYGKYMKFRAFTYSDGSLLPIENTSEVTLNDLKDYESEKKQISDNIINFLSGLPYANMLLYGDRGTGKSSTMHAMLNKYFGQGLRIIELNKQNMLCIPDIRRAVRDIPLKFIIFIDDLSLNEDDDKISSLKAGLEGTVGGTADNVMITATSNRRHIVKESFSDRENSVHPGDSMAEQLSLADRFGLTVMFASADRRTYLSIVRQLADERAMSTDRDKLCALAERWALSKGGRSPRRARQFADLAYACERRGAEIDF